ncbi:hypothetical protein AAG570_003969 [Ranatra chinensis]|uniref:Protein msta n=1 Tax=Ranatra chinensis TaxID=642074 RepID=A0ABD0Y2G1_9HEMI
MDERSEIKACIVCGQEATSVCSNCKNAAYCSKEHQKSDWKNHKTCCFPFEVKKNDDLGRHMVATRDIPSDSLIFSELPIVYGPKIVNPEPQCLGCYSPLDLDTSVYCPGCHWPVCSPLCLGLSDQQHHFPECAVLSKNTEIMGRRQFNYEAITPLRCLILQKRNKRKWGEFISMQSHMDKRGPNSEVYKELDERIVKYIIENFMAILDPGIPPATSSEIIHQICGVLEVNGLEVTAGRNDILALYPKACLMEHSCLPNTKHTFQPIDFKIKMYSSIEIKCGAHISTMYTHALWGTVARREHLKETKYFNCKCERCADPTELGTNLSSLRCIGVKGDINEACGGTILPLKPLDDNTEWKCNRCPVVLSSGEAADLTARLGQQVDLELEDPNVEKSEELLRGLETFLHTSHYHCYMVKHSLIQLYGREDGYSHDRLSDERLNKKIAMCEELLQITQTLDQGKSRLLLYLAVINYEFHSALVELSRRTDNKDSKLSLLKKSINMLQNNVSLLSTEQQYSAGSDLLNISNVALNNVRNIIESI